MFGMALSGRCLTLSFNAGSEKRDFLCTRRSCPAPECNTPPRSFFLDVDENMSHFEMKGPEGEKENRQSNVVQPEKCVRAAVKHGALWCQHGNGGFSLRIMYRRHAGLCGVHGEEGQDRSALRTPVSVLQLHLQNCPGVWHLPPVSTGYRLDRGYAQEPHMMLKDCKKTESTPVATGLITKYVSAPCKYVCYILYIFIWHAVQHV